MAYQCFGDVVTFDTTYCTNKYDMSFSPFTGVNHHYQSIQFGCALLQDETESTFLWLFETWLEAMGGVHPLCIITDQDMAMKGAIAKKIPTTRHCLCIWNIMKKFGEKWSHVYYKSSNFKSGMNKCIWATYKIDDFEKQWKQLIEEHELGSNEWLQQIYVLRHSWVPLYNRGTFFAGMNTTGRSEGTNSFFDDFVTSTKNLREFVVKYEQALDELFKKISEINKVSHKYVIESQDDVMQVEGANNHTGMSSNSLLLDPNISQTKGRKKDESSIRNTTSSKRIKSSMELVKNKQRKFIICQQPRHNKLTCPLNPDAKRKATVSTDKKSKFMEEPLTVSNEDDSDEVDSSEDSIDEDLNGDNED